MKLPDFWKILMNNSPLKLQRTESAASVYCMSKIVLHRLSGPGKDRNVVPGCIRDIPRCSLAPFAPSEEALPALPTQQQNAPPGAAPRHRAAFEPSHHSHRAQEAPTDTIRFKTTVITDK